MSAQSVSVIADPKTEALDPGCRCSVPIALFTVSSAYLHYNKIKHVSEAISGYFVLLARNCLASTLDYIVMQIGKTNREKGY